MLLDRLFSTKLIFTVHNVLIKATIDLLYHGVLILDGFFVFDKYLSKECITWKAFPLIPQRVPPVSLTRSFCGHYPTHVINSVPL